MTSSSLLAGLSIFSSLCFAQTTDLKLIESVEPHMGSLFRIKVYAADEKTAQAAFQAAFARIAELDRILTDYNPDSELSRATRSANLHVSEDLAAVISASQRLSHETDGAFDLTIGPLSQLWRKARKQQRMPGPEEIQAARARCDYRRLHLDETKRLLTTDLPDMQLDAGGIAKGYAADQALAVINKLGIHSALVAASGDLAFSDAPPGKAGWKIGVDSLDSADKPFTRILMLHNAAVSTSGDTEQFLRSGEKNYSHIIDPKTGVGLTSHLSVTIIAPDGITADPAATALSVMGCEKGLAYIEGHSKLAAFILQSEQGSVHAYESTRFQQLVKENVSEQ